MGLIVAIVVLEMLGELKKLNPKPETASEADMLMLFP